ncbi:MAG: hypothetical protein KAR13_20735 [Desulfobulbaceae bacterium]|nr:hypothetical protein [Desulfobulbaceae bacterium]
MTVPKKPKNADDFIKSATADKTKKLNPPDKKQFLVRLSADLHATIKANSSGNMGYWAEQIFRDHFKRNNIDILDIQE